MSEIASSTRRTTISFATRGALSSIVHHLHGLRLFLASLPFAMVALIVAGCERNATAPQSDAGPRDTAPPWDVIEPEPEPRPGMVWIPAGVLIAGTPLDRIPRIADEEMAGEQVTLHGFYVDIFPHPNEEGAIPTTNITQQEAKTLCEDQQKRLCTELELERACKGTGNTTYEYGDAYRASTCATGQHRTLTPTGVNATCVSTFGVHDLHGGIWTWTASPWRRNGNQSNLVTVRGGNGSPGDLIGRCAHGRGIKPDARYESVGVRCCAGEPNSPEVVLEVTHGKPLRFLQGDTHLTAQLEALAPEEAHSVAHGRPGERFKVRRVWIWHPLGNEELVLGGGCANAGQGATCGILVARVRGDSPQLLAFVPADLWQPTISEADNAREIFLYGGDRIGAFRRRVSYDWGRIVAADKERKRKLKNSRKLSFD